MEPARSGPRPRPEGDAGPDRRHAGDAPDHGAGDRATGLVSYLLVARPVDTAAKGLVAPVAYLAVHLGGEAGGVAVGVAVAVWLVFELGLYQARYGLNDLADAEVDRAHVAAGTRGRAAIDARARRWVLAAVAGRLTIALMVLALLPPDGRAVLALAALALLGITLAYEGARSAMRRRPLDDWRHARFGGRELVVLGLLGSGYALRAGLGAALAGVAAPVLVSIVVLGWAVGTLAVGMTWLDEAAVLKLAGGAAVLTRKTHIAALARLIGDDPEDADRPLLHGAAARTVGCMLAVASAAGVAFAASLGGPPGPAGLVLLLALVVVVGPVVVATWSSPWAGLVVTVLGAVAGWALAGSGGRLEMAVVLAFVALAPAITRPISIRPLLPD